MAKKEDIIQKYLEASYPGAFASAATFHKELSRRSSSRISLQKVKRTLSGNEKFRLHKQTRTVFPRRIIYVPTFGHQLVIDLVDVSKYKNFNSNTRFILVAVDGFSRYAYAAPLPNKGAKAVTAAMDKILIDSKHKYKFIQSDKGKEFWNADFLALLERRGIKLFSTQSTVKAALAERFIRTLMTRIGRWMSITGKKSFVPLLPQFISNYNDTTHRTIGRAPSSVNEKTKAEVYERLYKNKLLYSIQKPKLKVGTVVLLTKNKLGKFAKGYAPRFHEEKFVIRGIKNTNPVMYLLKDMSGREIEGGVYLQELQAV